MAPSAVRPEVMVMKLTGKPVSRGIVLGRVLKYRPFVPSVSDAPISTEDVEAAWARYDKTVELARQELDRLEARLLADSPDKAKIVAAHREILQDPAMDEEIRGLIGARTPPDAAIERVYGSFIELLGRSKNEMMRERASDLVDVKNRLLRCWAGEPERNLARLEQPVIVVADDLYPSDTVSMDRSKVLGIITQVGGATSHTAIIARSYEIPAVLGVPGALAALEDGAEIVLDAVKGEIVLCPTGEECAAYAAAAEQVRENLRETAAYLDAEPVTLDGVRAEVRLNVAAANDFELSGAAHADGCGLFRTEFLYLEGDRLPGEEEQYQIYKRVLLAFGEKPVVLRTLDVGGDKQLACLELPHESNPFLGVRGLRLCLAHEALLRTQVRAALRASVHGSLRVMLPMVGALDEVRAAKAIFREEGEALSAAGIPWNPSMPVGIMVEVPSIALIADLAADEVDFVSVGTNDLCQYLTASDRMNPSVKPYHQDYHPAMFRALGYIARSFQAAGKPVSVCGELGGDPLAIPALLGLGIQKLSMSRASLAGAKRVIRSIRMEDAQALAQRVQSLKTEGEIKACLTEFARAHKSAAPG
ncbi:phosphoenolpyruvate--protein phosphotransferase [Pseudoflavonifractor sp. BIOML-A6]|nr:phosphoenolpyruvate--protein phosphotransferase [Pseudoflavonifractor sp. BIOML-A16]MTR04573.1 phosphoenolpyruvate--protein phosphotransferase [Pseudoflavonifractor sp. BIOML-A15]MTR11962.1 phosphoenolpyruvate--protein phosphotransferase [Pseudoflavonifractor sp. BIOML-A17]MTR19716.1 phosphoenolpyruvate--protein phosphotransferase [Pseudoflavonifractor sp. BIOML-A19]MTR31179.1 phosphoenolpyruvate--protein phosphotransferase [Pseudoflavonifractor sp. BIOML-A14]MTR34469.1 phosphoenolpyruvate-